MSSSFSKVRRFADIVHFPNSGARKSRTVGEIARAASTTILLSNILGARRLFNYATDQSPPHFQFYKRQAGGKHAVIMINGFLSQENLDVTDWEASLARKFGRATWYHLDWNATRTTGKQWSRIMSIDGLLDRVDGKSDPGTLTAWHSAMMAAEKAGALLADAIACTPDWRYTLVGHSLGARVIHFALKTLAGNPRKCVENAYLLGGAVGGGAKDDACWEAAVSAVKGNIFNCYSRGDSILRFMYQGANAAMSEPVGYSGINLRHPRIVSHDASLLVDGHSEWKQHFGSILDQLAA